MIDTDLRETIDELDALLTEQAVAGFRPLIERARDQTGALIEERDRLDRELDPPDPPEWMFEDARNEAFANAARAATDLLLDVRRGLFTLDEAVERMHRLEDQ